MATTTNHTSKYLFLAFAAVVVGISALTSFAFFATFLPSLVPSILASADGGALISGVVGVVLLDAACLVWLRSAEHAETSQQSSIGGIAAALTFAGSAVASVAHLALNASDIALSQQARSAVGMAALIGVILAVVLNFGLSILYAKNSAGAQENRRITKRHRAMNDAEEKQADLLHGMVAERITKKLEKKAPDLAEESATMRVSDFLAGESRKNGVKA